MRRTFGTPVTFGECVGFIHDGGGTTGVLMLPAWGFEEFTIRRGWSRFADILADAGYACLRFDWPGAGDSLGDTGATVALAQWNQAVMAAADLLRSRCEVDRIVLIGHGVGALMAPHFARALSVEAMVLMAPQNEGRVGLRELDLSGKLIGSYLKLPDQGSDKTLNIAGHSMARTLAQEIAALQLTDDHLQPAAQVMTVLRADTRAAVEWPKRLRAIGFPVCELDYSAYDDYLAHNKASVAPISDFEKVRDWLLDTAAPRPRPYQGGNPVSANALVGEGFDELPVIFGPNDRLFGVLCRPVGRPCRAAVILVNSGDTYHIGWGRMHVSFARALANMGIASFRIDTSGIGDSQAIDRPLYFDDAQICDILDAVTFVEGCNLGPTLVSGLCSGGYASVQAAVRDARIKGMVAVNPVRLAIDPVETFEQILNAGTSSLAEYRRRALSPQLLKDVLRGRVSALSIMSKIVRILKARLASFSLRNRLRKRAREQAEALRSRGVTSVLIFSEGDAGLDELARFFGKRAPADYDNAIVRIVSETEHNMTALHAREAIMQGIIDASQPDRRDIVESRAVAA